MPSVVTHPEKNLRVVYGGGVSFLKSLYFTDIMPFDLNVKNCDELVDLLYVNKDWCKIVFGIKGVKKYNITSFFFQLFATKILSFKLVDKKVVSCTITRDDNEKLLYETVENWEGMKFCTKKLRGGAVEIKDIIAAHEKAVEILDSFYSNFLHHKQSYFKPKLLACLRVHRYQLFLILICISCPTTTVFRGVDTNWNSS